MILFKEDIFIRAFHLPLIPANVNDNKENVDSVALSLNDDFKQKKINSDQYAEKISKRSDELSQDFFNLYSKVINKTDQLHNMGRVYEALLKVFNFLKFMLVMLLMLIQLSLFKSLQKRTRAL